MHHMLDFEQRNTYGTVCQTISLSVLQSVQSRCVCVCVCVCVCMCDFQGLCKFSMRLKFWSLGFCEPYTTRTLNHPVPQHGGPTTMMCGAGAETCLQTMCSGDRQDVAQSCDHVGGDFCHGNCSQHCSPLPNQLTWAICPTFSTIP